MLSRAFARVAQRAVLWCLLVAAPVYGVSSAVAQVMGSPHARRVVSHIDERLTDARDTQRSIARDLSVAQLQPSTFEGPCQAPLPAAVVVLDARAFDSLGDDSPDATSGFALAMTPAVPIEPLDASSSPPRRSHAVVVLTRDGSRLDRPPKA